MIKNSDAVHPVHNKKALIFEGFFILTHSLKHTYLGAGAYCGAGAGTYCGTGAGRCTGAGCCGT